MQKYGNSTIHESSIKRSSTRLNARQRHISKDKEREIIRSSPRGTGLAYIARYKLGREYPKPSQSRHHEPNKRVASTNLKNSGATLQKLKSKKKLRQTLFNSRFIGVSFAVVLVTFGGVLWAYTIRTNISVTEQVKALQSGTNSNNTDSNSALPEPARPSDYDETSPDNNSSYIVGPDLPRYLIIDELGIKARVKRMGVTSSNAIQSPRNIYDVGWYEGGAKPGEDGVMFINGHVSGPGSKGIFYDLKLLKITDKIIVEKGDGTKVTYVVTSNESVSVNQVEMDKVLRPQGDNKEGLSLMTCSGNYNSSSNSYDKRRLVYAVPIEETSN